MSENEQLVRMEVKGLMLDPASNVPIVILRNEDGSEFLPIWIGIFEANSIALKLEGVEPPRPMTHDLLAHLLTAVGAVVHRIVICDLEESTFHAQIQLTSADRELAVDARPSDAIALALRVGAPIYVNETVIHKAKAADMANRISDEEKLKKWLEDVDPDDLGKYTM
ncbi:MAG: bifunctional nuclease family protein [bacterium]|nr:bifunctional nuclease family protein [bacterium]